MTRFNTTVLTPKVTNAAGGEAHGQSPQLELISILLTSFATDSTYRSADATFERLKHLVSVCDPKFVAKAAIYARTRFGMRSITHVVASELASRISGNAWAKDFYAAIVYRPDDMMEILAYHTANNGKIPNSIKKGFAKAFDKFDRYSLAKYRGEGKGYKLIDVVNLVHPLPNDKNRDAIKALVNGDLRSFDTWEVELTKAGQLANGEDEKRAMKSEAWAKLISEKKLGYMALLKNLRNIIEQAPEYIDAALTMLVDAEAIMKSLVLPFRYLSAYEAVRQLNDGSIVRKTMMALNTAVDIAISNVPKFKGETLVVLDVSGSMNESHMGIKSPHVIGALFSAVLVKSNNCDFMVFSDKAKYHNVNPNDSTITISDSLKFAEGGTNFHSIFETANRVYDRVIILSDMQGWIGYNTPRISFSDYKKRTGADPFIYSFDLKNYGSMQFPERNVFALAGFSEKVFDTMAMMEQDKNALIREIEAVEF